VWMRCCLHLVKCSGTDIVCSIAKVIADTYLQSPWYEACYTASA
jgi:hypothetical protein